MENRQHFKELLLDNTTRSLVTDESYVSVFQTLSLFELKMDDM